MVERDWPISGLGDDSVWGASGGWCCRSWKVFMIPNCFDGVSHGLKQFVWYFRVCFTIDELEKEKRWGRSWLIIVALVAVGLQLLGVERL